MPPMAAPMAAAAVGLTGPVRGMGGPASAHMVIKSLVKLNNLN